MWTPDALKSEAHQYTNSIWRLVEDQWKSATMRITDSLVEQALLEDILEETKPPLPAEAEGFHFLISTPFRYSPYPHGSRFRRAGQPEGVFYGSEAPSTAVAETAFYRLLFFLESPATEFPQKPVIYTAFSVPVSSAATIDLTSAPFERDAERWSDPTDYSSCQSLADAARKVGIEIIRYRSVRDAQQGINVAVLALSGFKKQEPVNHQTWHIFLRPEKIQVWCEMPSCSLEIPFSRFNNDPRIAAAS